MTTSKSSHHQNQESNHYSTLDSDRGRISHPFWRCFFVRFWWKSRTQNRPWTVINDETYWENLKKSTSKKPHQNQRYWYYPVSSWVEKETPCEQTNFGNSMMGTVGLSVGISWRLAAWCLWRLLFLEPLDSLGGVVAEKKTDPTKNMD